MSVKKIFCGVLLIPIFYLLNQVSFQRGMKKSHYQKSHHLSKEKSISSSRIEKTQISLINDNLQTSCPTDFSKKIDIEKILTKPKISQWENTEYLLPDGKSYRLHSNLEKKSIFGVDSEGYPIVLSKKEQQRIQNIMKKEGTITFKEISYSVTLEHFGKVYFIERSGIIDNLIIEDEEYYIECQTQNSKLACRCHS